MEIQCHFSDILLTRSSLLFEASKQETNAKSDEQEVKNPKPTSLEPTAPVTHRMALRSGPKAEESIDGAGPSSSSESQIASSFAPAEDRLRKSTESSMTGQSQSSPKEELSLRDMEISKASSASADHFSTLGNETSKDGEEDCNVQVSASSKQVVDKMMHTLCDRAKTLPNNKNDAQKDPPPPSLRKASSSFSFERFSSLEGVSLGGTSSGSFSACCNLLKPQIPPMGTSEARALPDNVPPNLDRAKANFLSFPSQPPTCSKKADALTANLLSSTKTSTSVQGNGLARVFDDDFIAMSAILAPTLTSNRPIDNLQLHPCSSSTEVADFRARCTAVRNMMDAAKRKREDQAETDPDKMNTDTDGKKTTAPAN
jgi:hypothetical protein